MSRILVEKVSHEHYMRTMVENKIFDLNRELDKLKAALELPLNQLEEWFNKREDYLCDTIEDGFGTQCSAYCDWCGKKSMVFVRPGEVQCNECSEGRE